MNKFLTVLLIFSLWVTANAQLLGREDAIVYAMDVESSSHLIAAAIDKNRIEIWNYESKSLSKSIQLNRPCTALAFVGNRYVAFAQSDGTIEVFSLGDFEKIVSVKAGDGPIISLLSPDKKILLAADTKGNVFSSGEIGTGVSFRKLFSASFPVTGMDVMPVKGIIITAHDNRSLSFWNLETGKLIKTENPGLPNIFQVKCDSTESNILVTAGNNKLVMFSFEGDQSLYKLNTDFLGSWPTAIDRNKGMTAVGTSSGKVRIDATGISYKMRLPYIINHVRILKEYFPSILIAVGTHGGGIRLVHAVAMTIQTY